jgi:FixJ family two-component response regulator
MQTEANNRSVVHIVDDDESLRHALDSLFRSVGLQVRAYGSDREFLDAERDEVPGCLVLDVRLPGISGLDFRSFAHDDSIKPSIEVVMAREQAERIGLASKLCDASTASRRKF